MSIEAMKMALEVLEQINQLSIGENAIALPGEIDAAMDNLRAAIEQAEKPVAWMYVNTDGECEEIEYGQCEFDDPSIQLLYTAPRQWVGLTEEETQTMYDRYATYQEYDAWESGWFDFARGIEAKLKEKNAA
jgi:hypothetical protein